MTSVAGVSKVHLAVSTLVNGTPILFPDDIDVDWENEIVYMSDGSTKWDLAKWVWGVIESDTSSRYGPWTGSSVDTVTVAILKIGPGWFPNGISNPRVTSELRS